MANKDCVYCEAAIKQAAVNEKYHRSFDEIVQKDSPGRSFGFDQRILTMQCIDMDQVETDRSGSNKRTMDLLVGIANFNDNSRKYSSIRLLPIELKLNCESFNLSKSALKNKDTHTRTLLLGTIFTKESLFLFPQDLISVAQSNLNRWSKGSNAAEVENWVFISPEQINAYIHFEEDYPYQPKTDFQVISSQIDTHIQNGNIERCAKYLDGTIRPQVEKLRAQYMKDEVVYIINQLKAKMDQVYSELPSNTDPTEKEYLKICVDDILAIKL